MILKCVLGSGLTVKACHMTRLCCAINRGTETRWPQGPGLVLLYRAGISPGSLRVTGKVQLVAFFLA